MAEHSSSSSASSASLESLLHEIEETPKEYWAELLYALQQFRRKIPPTAQPVIDIEQAQKNQAAIDLLDSWLGDDEDASEHQQAWDFLKKALLRRGEKVAIPEIADYEVRRELLRAGLLRSLRRLDNFKQTLEYILMLFLHHSPTNRIF